MNLHDFFLSPAVVTMADTPQIEKRLRAILDARLPDAGRRVGRAGVAVAALFALAAFGSLAVLRPVAVRAQQNENAAKRRDAACLDNLKLIGRALSMYAQDYDEKLPPTTSPAGLENRLRPYIYFFYAHHGPGQPGGDLTLPPLDSGPSANVTPLFTCPETNRRYLSIAPISGASLVLLDAPKRAPVLRDTAPHTDGTWNVVYADGHAQAETTLPPVVAPRPFNTEARARLQARVVRADAERAAVQARARVVQQEMARLGRDQQRARAGLARTQEIWARQAALQAQADALAKQESDLRIRAAMLRAQTNQGRVRTAHTGTMANATALLRQQIASLEARTRLLRQQLNAAQARRQRQR